MSGTELGYGATRYLPESDPQHSASRCHKVVTLPRTLFGAWSRCLARYSACGHDASHVIRRVVTSERARQTEREREKGREREANCVCGRSK
eukprot:1815242-Rhodomonas_salina.1